MQSCEQCRLCCRLIEIIEVSSPVNEWCKHCSIESGCEIYATKPEGCENFNCSWKLDDGAHISMRPDKAKVIFENVAEDIVFGTAHPDYKIKRRVWNQIYAFVKSGSSVVLHTPGNPKPLMALADGAKGSEVWQRILDKRDEVRELRNDSTELHN